MVAYALLGHPLTDLIELRKLLAISSVRTSLGEAALGQVPTLATLKTLYAYRGFTTVALFWTALIRATRELGGEMAQCSSFGFLDRGRRLLTAVTDSRVVSLYASLLPADVESASAEVRARALQQIDSMRWRRYQELEFPAAFSRPRPVRQ